MTWNEFKFLLRGGTSTLTDDSQSISFEELLSEAELFGKSVRSELQDTDRVIGISGTNSIDYLIALLAVLSCNRIPTPLNTRLTQNELGAILEQVRARLSIQAERISDSGEWLHSVPRSFSEHSDEFKRRLPSIIICSSGSEGKVKAASLSLDSFVNHARAVNQHLRVTSSDHWLACLPFYHVGGLTIPFRCALAGADVTILPSADPEAVNNAIESNKITLISMVATSLSKLLDYREDKPFPKHLRAIITGGGPVPSHLLDRCPVVYKTYGMTESGSMLTCARPGCDDAERYSAGSVLPETMIRIADDSGNERGAGEEGNVLAKGAGVFDGYVNDEERTVRAFSDGWLKTGDYGYLDKNGSLNILARRKDLILSGGENIIPAEIENMIREHPDVANAVVLPIEDKEWGQVPGVVIVSTNVTEEMLLEFLKDRLASYKLPRRFVFVKNLPTLSSGKVDLSAVRKILNA